MATLGFVEDENAPEDVRQLYERIREGFGAGQVPTVYKALAHNPAVLAAAVDNRARVMDEGKLDPVLKEWLAWAAVTLANNAFGIQMHTARLRKLGVTPAAIIEALAVLQYFTGISTVINGLVMDDDVDEATRVAIDPATGLVTAIAKHLPRWDALDTGAFLFGPEVWDAVDSAPVDCELGEIYARRVEARRLAAIDVTGESWYDIDTEEDLAGAGAMLAAGGAA